MPTPRIKDTAIMIGYDESNNHVYSEAIDILEYYDGEHLWDDPKKIMKIKMKKLIGYLFDHKGKLNQEFRNEFDLTTGECLRTWVRFDDGTINES